VPSTPGDLYPYWRNLTVVYVHERSIVGEVEGAALKGNAGVEFATNLDGLHDGKG
jgi:hypothetical protein